jgi:hypothetical protein
MRTARQNRRYFHTVFTSEETLVQRQSKVEHEDSHVKVWYLITVSRNCDATGMEKSLLFLDVKLRGLCNIPEEEEDLVCTAAEA